MDPPFSRQQMIDFIQSQRANFESYGTKNELSLMYQKDGNKMRYKYPVNTKQCRHINTQELDQILQTKRCDVCPNTINSYKDLVMDIRWIANKIMHPDIEFISIIQGHIFHQFPRPREYIEIFNELKHKQLVEDLFRNHNGKYDFMQLAKEDPQYQNAKPTDLLHYDTFCQLDFVKIQIPVRHKDCKHVGCYELTSLLAYRKEILASNSYQKYIECLGYKCQVKIDLNRLEQDLVLDKELLNAIRKSHPHQIKFYFNPKNYKLIDEHTFNKNQDPYLKEYYIQNMLNVDDQKYKVFQNEIFSILQYIYIQRNQVNKERQQLSTNYLNIRMKLCKCRTCISQPIMSMNDIIFDEFFQMVLDELELRERQSEKTQNQQLLLENQNNIMRSQDVLPRPGFQSIQTEDEFEIALEQFQMNQKNIEEFNLYQIQERTQYEISNQLKYLNEEPL